MESANSIRVPRGLAGLDPLVLDMDEIRKAEIRLPEVALTNALRAPELLATFNSSYLVAARYANQLEYELGAAQRRLSEARAIFLIDKLPGLLAEKGLATARSPLGSEDIRQAFLDRDPEYKQIQEVIATIETYKTMMDIYKRGFENAYNSVKKLIGNAPSPNFLSNPNLIVEPTTVASKPAFSPSAASEWDNFFGEAK